jgi:hypothetical protein
MDTLRSPRLRLRAPEVGLRLTLTLRVVIGCYQSRSIAAYTNKLIRAQRIAGQEVDAEASLRPTSGQEPTAVRSEVARVEHNVSMTPALAWSHASNAL